MRFGGEPKSIRGQSVGEDCAGLQLVEKLATPLALFLDHEQQRSYERDTGQRQQIQSIVRRGASLGFGGGGGEK